MVDYMPNMELLTYMIKAIMRDEMIKCFKGHIDKTILEGCQEIDI